MILFNERKYESQSTGLTIKKLFKSWFVVKFFHPFCIEKLMSKKERDLKKN